MDHEDKDTPAAATGGVSRRGFITSVGSGAIGVAAAGALVQGAPPQAQAEAVKAGDVSTITLTVNGRTQKLLVEARWSLLYVLRDQPRPDRRPRSGASAASAAPAPCSSTARPATPA